MANNTANITVSLNSQEAHARLEELQADMKRLIALKKQAEKAGDVQGYKKIDAELKRVTRSTNSLLREHKSLSATLKNLNGASIKELREAQRQLTSQTDKLNRSTTAYASKHKQLAMVKAEIMKINNQYRTQQSLVSRLGDGFNKYMGLVMGIGAAITGIIMGVKKIKAVMDEFETSITNVYTLLGESDFTLYKDTLDKGSIEILKTYGFAIEDINKALFDTVSAGIPAKDSIKFMDEAARLALGGVTTLSISVDGMTSVMNAYSMEMSKAEKVSSAFFTAQKYGKTTVGELAQNIGAVVPVAAAAGIGVNELLSAVASMTTRGVRTNMAMTSMKNIIQSVVKPTKEAEVHLRKYGVPIGATAVKAAGLTTVLEKLNGMMKENPDIVAKAIPNIRGFLAASTLSGEGLTKYHEILESVNKDFGESSSLSSAYTKQMETDVQKMNSALGSRKASILELGQELKPLFMQIIRLGSTSFHVLLKTIRFIFENKHVLGLLIKVIFAYIAATKLALLVQTLYNSKLTASIVLTKAKVLWLKLWRSALLLVAIAHALLTGNITRASTAMRVFNTVTKLNPFGIVAAALAAVIAGLALYIKKINIVTAAQKALNDVEITAQQNITEQKTKAQELLRIASDHKISTDLRIIALSALNKISPEFFGNLKLETINAELAKTALDKYTKSILLQAKAIAAREMMVELEKNKIASDLRPDSEKLNFWQQTKIAAFNNQVKLAKKEEYLTKNQTKLDEIYGSQKEKLTEIIKTQTDAMTDQQILASLGLDDFPEYEEEDVKDVDHEAAAEKAKSIALNALTETHNQRLLILKNLLLKEEITDDEFKARMIASEIAFLELKKQLLEQFGKSTTETDLQIIDKRIELSKIEKETLLKIEQDFAAEIAEEQKKNDDALAESIEESIELGKRAMEEKKNLHEKEIKLAEEKGRLYTDLAVSIGESFEEMLLNQELSFGQFLKNTLMMALDALEKIMIAKQAEIIMEGIAKTGLFNPLAMAKAFAKIVLLKAAFGGAKAVIMGGGGKSKTKGYADGKYPGLQTGTYGDKPHYALFNEVPGQPETVIDGLTTRKININYPAIMKAIYAVRDGRAPQYATGKYPPPYSNVPFAKGDERSGGGSLAGGIDPALLAIIEANTAAMKELKNLKIYTAIEGIKRGEKKYTEIQNTRGL